MKSVTRSRFATALLIIASIGLIGAANDACALTLQGSTTFNTTLIARYGKDIERETGLRIEVIANKSSLGLLALFEGRADLAMISMPLPNEVEILRSSAESLPLERLRSFEICRVPAAFVVHPENPVRMLPLASIRRILLGEITNWKELGGPDVTIRVVAVRPGGGVLGSVEAKLLGNGHIAAPHAIRVQVGTQIVKVVAQEPGALGITQRSIVSKSQTVELKTDQPIEQVLSLVSLGEPSDEARRVIAAMQRKVNSSP